MALLTEHVFHYSHRMGDLVAIVCGIAAIGCATALWIALPAYRRLLDTPIPASVAR